MDFSNAFGGIGSLISGGMGMGASPYSAGMKPLKDYSQQAIDYQNPFYKGGTDAIPKYTNWLDTMKDPSQFINNTMNSYQQSPFAKFQQQQSMRAANNSASANGLLGSTPMQMQAQQNAQNISSQDMQQWLQNVLGVNSQYGQGQQGMVGMGQNSANNMSSIMSQLAQLMSGAQYGQQAGSNQDMGNIIGGLMSLML